MIARAGGYELAPNRVAIDADDFEARARAGLEALRRGETARAETELTAAARAYGGDFLADEPYAEWALAERDRLRELAAQVLRGLAGLQRAGGDEDAPRRGSSASSSSSRSTSRPSASCSSSCCAAAATPRRCGATSSCGGATSGRSAPSRRSRCTS